MHYSSRHHNYYRAWLNVTKSDREFKESSGHPELRNRGEPRTEAAWDMKNAEATLQRSQKSRMLLLEEAGEGDCVDGCDGRGKNRNLLLTGSTNCGKSFLLNPLKVIYRNFCNPATGTFALVGVENAECILLNDFRWSAQIIPWHDLLLMLEGNVVNLPAPKIHYSTDICCKKTLRSLPQGKAH